MNWVQNIVIADECIQFSQFLCVLQSVARKNRKKKAIKYIVKFMKYSIIIKSDWKNKQYLFTFNSYGFHLFSGGLDALDGWMAVSSCDKTMGTAKKVLVAIVFNEMIKQVTL